MKKFALATLMTVLSLILHSQAPPNFRYQTVLRNNTGEILANKSVGLKISILKDNPSGQVVYSETFSSLTNGLGLINLSIGSGDAIFGSISSIDWKEGPFFMRIDVDQEGGSNFEFLGTSQLLSVPYALYAEKSGNVAIVDSELYWKRNVNNLYYNAGNIGIGTFNPVSLLNIAGSVQSGTGRNLLQIQNNTNDNFSYTGILLKTGLSGGQSVIQDYGINYTASSYYDFAGFLNLSNNSRGVMLHANSANGVIKFYTGHDDIAGAGIERMRIDASGNVGIGTLTPQTKLVIEDEITGNKDRALVRLRNTDNSDRTSVSLSLESNDKQYGTSFTQTSAGFSTIADFDRMGAISTNGKGFSIYSVSDYGSIRFYTNRDVNGIVERMRIDASGNVGIGTNAPKAKLEIANGDVYIKDIDHGVIMTSPSGQCWRGTINDSGILQFTAVVCP